MTEDNTLVTKAVDRALNQLRDRVIVLWHRERIPFMNPETLDAEWRRFCDSKVYPLIDEWEKKVREITTEASRRDAANSAWYKLSDEMPVEILEAAIRNLQASGESKS